MQETFRAIITEMGGVPTSKMPTREEGYGIAPGGHSTVVPRADPISAGATSPPARSREPRTGAESTSAIASTHPIPIVARIGTPPRKSTLPQATPTTAGCQLIN